MQLGPWLGKPEALKHGMGACEYFGSVDISGSSGTAEVAYNS